VHDSNSDSFVSHPNLPLGVALTPDKTAPYTALAGDFFFMNV
jgi:hypothetical protein